MGIVMKLPSLSEKAAGRRAVRQQEELVRGLEGVEDDASVVKRSEALAEIGSHLERLGNLSDAARHYAEAEAALRRVGVEREEIVVLEIRRGKVLILLERFEEALEVFSHVIDEVGIGGTLPVLATLNPETADDLIVVAVRLWLFALDRLGRVEQAGTAAEAVIAEFGVGSTSTRRAVVAEAFRLAGVAARAVDDVKQALTCLEEAAKRTDEVVGEDLAATQVRALLELVTILRDGLRNEDAVDVLDELLVRFGDVKYEFVQTAVAAARRAQAELTGQRQPTPGHALTAAVSPASRPGEKGVSETHPDRGEEEARLMQHIGDNESILQATEGASDDDSVQKRGVAWWEMAVAMRKLGQFAKAIQYYREADPILWRYESLHPKAVLGRHGMAIALIECGRLEQALEAITSTIDKVGLGATFPRNPNALASVSSTWLLVLERLGRMNEAATAASAVIATFDHGSTPTQLKVVADAFRLQGVAARARGDRATALAAFDEAIKRAQAGEMIPNSSRGEQMTGIRAEAMAGRAAVLAEEGRTDAAMAACDELLAEFASTSSPLVRAALAEVGLVRDALATAESG
jgi:tetratricopeptide (TPR) repeat protein